MTQVIDLQRIRAPLIADFKEALRVFASTRPDADVSAVGVYGDGFHGWVALWLDTPEHAAAHVERWRDKGPGWFGEDENGVFNDNCPDFAHHLGDFRLSGFPDLYAIDDAERIVVVELDGRRREISAQSEDQAFHALIFPLMRQAAYVLAPYPTVRRAAPFRIVFQYIGEGACDVWTMPDAPQGGA